MPAPTRVGLLWALPPLAKGNAPLKATPAPAKPAKPAKRATPAPPPAKPAVKSPNRSVAAPKTAPATPQRPPAPKKPPKPPTADVLRATKADPDYALLGTGNPLRHPYTGQELSPVGPGRAPRLFTKIGEVSKRTYWRYEGSECWSYSIPGALHTWIAVFGKYFKKEMDLLVKAYENETDVMPDDDLLSEDEDLLS